MLEDAFIWLKRKGNQTPRKSLNSEVRCASSDKKMVRQITGSLKILRHSSRPEVNHWSKSRSMRDIFLFKVLKSKKVKKKTEIESARFLSNENSNQITRFCSKQFIGLTNGTNDCPPNIVAIYILQTLSSYGHVKRNSMDYMSG